MNDAHPNRIESNNASLLGPPETNTTQRCSERIIRPSFHASTKLLSRRRCAPSSPMPASNRVARDRRSTSAVALALPRLLLFPKLPQLFLPPLLHPAHKTIFRIRKAMQLLANPISRTTPAPVTPCPSSSSPSSTLPTLLRRLQRIQILHVATTNRARPIALHHNPAVALRLLALPLLPLPPIHLLFIPRAVQRHDAQARQVRLHEAIQGRE
jgi:hypothetical protein